jgi:hypothetical protein
MKKLVLLSILFSQIVNATEGSGYLMNMKGNDIDIKSSISSQKQLDLSDSFLVQLFGSWKAAGALSPKINTWVKLVLNKDFNKALDLYPSIISIAPKKFAKTIKASKLYIYHNLGMNTLFVNSWLELSNNESLLTTEVGLALDHVIGTNTSKWLIDSGVVLMQTQKKKLKNLEKAESRVNYSLQAFNALRNGKQTLEWIRKIPSNDPLRLELTKSALIDFAKMGELKASAKLIKEVFEPIIEKSQNTDEISNYYITLARLLYQAGAYEASRDYYKLIPEESKYFLSSQTEAIWVNLRLSDYPAVKGSLETLQMDVFKDNFHPEIYLVSAIANLKTCQFTNVKNNFKSFTLDNKSWAKTIMANLDNEKPKLIENDFFTYNILRNQKTINSEMEILNALSSKVAWANEISFLKAKLEFSNLTLNIETKRRWANRAQILDQAIYKMKFVKIEFISRMRDLSLALKNKYEDEVSTYAAAPTRNNQLKFPHDRVTWSDELFNMTAQVENLCLQGLIK